VVSPVATDVAVHLTTRPLLPSAFAMDTEPSALTTQPIAPAGHEQRIIGGEEQHRSPPVAEKVELVVGSQGAGPAGAAQVIVGGTGLICTVSEHVPVLPDESVAE
jgi:hypothetical protein